jgi:valyl-tRNA synthetase
MIDDSYARPLAVTKLVGNAELLVPLSGLIDKDAETARLKKEAEKMQSECDKINVKLANPAFVGKAPAQVVEKEKARLNELQSSLEKIKKQIEEISLL